MLGNLSPAGTSGLRMRRPAIILPSERVYARTMCRSIKTLRTDEGKIEAAEIQAAALQFVRKISGYRVPSRSNREVFDGAVQEITASSQKLLNSLVSRTKP